MLGCLGDDGLMRPGGRDGQNGVVGRMNPGWSFLPRSTRGLMASIPSGYSNPPVVGSNAAGCVIRIALGHTFTPSRGPRTTALPRYRALRPTAEPAASLRSSAAALPEDLLPENPHPEGNPEAEEDFLFFPAIDCTVSQKSVKLFRSWAVSSRLWEVCRPTVESKLPNIA